MHFQIAILRSKGLALEFLILYSVLYVCAHMDKVMLNVHLFVCC